jgi:hypothetical protein
MNWLHYLLEANIYLGVFYVAYCLFLNKETHYLLNRFYLVLSSIVSFILPVLQLGILLPPLPEPSDASYFVAEQVTNVPAPIAVPVQVTAPSFTFQDGLWYMYLAGTIICAVLLTIKLFSLFRLIRANKVTVHDNYKVVYLKDTNTAFSFFNYLFIGMAANNERTILRHELVHIRQKHSADILFLEFLKIINWFNPLVYLLQNSLKTQHEYIADEQTVTDEADATSYSSFLVNNAYGLSGPAITHSFYNLNLLKNRIIMLHQQRSGNLARLKYLVAVPIGAALLCASTLGFSKTYGWIDLAPKKVHKKAVVNNTRPASVTTKQKADDYYSGLAYFIEPYKYSAGDLKKTGLALHKEGYKMKYRKIGSNQLYISIESLPRLGQYRSANATFNMDELKKLNHFVAVGGGSISGEEKVFVQSVPKSDMKENFIPSLLEPQKPKNDQVKFPPRVKALVPAGFKPEKTYVNAKGYKIEEGMFSRGGRKSYLVIITDPSGKKIDASNKQFVAYKGMIQDEKIALALYGYKFPDVKVSPIKYYTKTDQVRFPPPIVVPDVPADFKPEKSYVNEKGFKVEEGPFTVGNKTYYVAIISNTTTGKKNIYYKGFNESRIKPELEDLGYTFPDVKVSSFLPEEPPKPKTDQVKFPPPIVKPDKSAPKRRVSQVKYPKIDVVKFPPPIVKPDKSVPKSKVSEVKPSTFKVADIRTDVVKFPPPVVRPTPAQPRRLDSL